MRLNGRVAFVTGSSRGIGAAIATRLAADGAKVILHARTPDRAGMVAEQIRDSGGAAHVVLGDLTEGDTPARLVQEAFAIYGALDILVCNAGGGGGGLAVNQTPETIDKTLALNLRATILSSIEFVRLTQSAVGRVIFISSGMAVHPAFGASIPSASKAGAEAFIRSLAQEVGGRGITCNTISPGTTQTDMIKDQDWPAKVPPWTALRRLRRPNDIADVVAFIASDESRWITGVTLPANGGLVTTATNIMAYG
jgi:3-oxoacyl-[acyl-carrier protein] reductase